MIWKSEIAGVVLRYKMRYPGTHFAFGSYVEPAEGEDFDVCATDDRLARTRTFLPEDARDYYVEYRALLGATALELLKYDRCIYHAVAFEYRGLAWLLTAGSGVGKTTQFLNWQRLFPGEIEMICGDMPVIEAGDDSIIVHSSAWNGKERMGSPGRSAKLGGIVALEQGDRNAISNLPAREAVFPLFTGFAVRPENEEQILALTSLMDRLYGSVPLMRFINLGDEESTAVLRSAINKTVESSGGEHGDL